MKKRICKICGFEFVPKTTNQKCCSQDCMREYESQYKSLEYAKKRKTIQPKITIDDVIRFQMKHKKETGKDLSYSECCAILEKPKTAMSAIFIDLSEQ